MAPPQYEFGPFRLDPNGPLLFRGKQIVPLAPKVADILLVLLESRGQVVEKDDLLKTVWPDTFVGESSLARTISILRKTLSDGADGAHGEEYVATVPKRGYRFVAPVKELAPRPAPASSERLMLAVLPFQNFSGDREQEYFADGLTEELTAQLSRLNPEQLRVIARTSAMAYKETSKSIAQIGRELGVDYILEGSVRKAGDRVRITAQLVLTRDQTHLWAQNYEERVADILTLQSEIAQAVAREVQIKLTPQHQQRLSRRRRVDPQAHDLYLRGRYCWNRRTESSVRKALDYFQQALEHDPTFAEGYVGMADSLNILGYYNALSPREAYPKAKAAAARALQLDDSLGEAHATLGVIKRDFEWDWAGAEREFQRAIELNAGYADAHHWYGTLFNIIGRPEDGERAMTAALNLDPLSPVINTDLGRTFYFARRYDDAVRQFRKTLDFDPNFGITHLWLGQVLQQQGLLDQAVAQLEKGAVLNGTSTYTLARLGHGYAFAGRKKEAVTILEQLREMAREKYVSPYDLALIQVALGDYDQAFAYLEQALADRSLWFAYLKVDPQVDALRKDPRFAALLPHAGLA